MKRILLSMLAAGTVLAVAGSAWAQQQVQVCYEYRPTIVDVFSGLTSNFADVSAADFQATANVRRMVQNLPFVVPCPKTPTTPTTDPDDPTAPGGGGATSAAKWVAVPPALEISGPFADKRWPVKRVVQNPDSSIAGSHLGYLSLYTWSQAETCSAAGMVPTTINGKDCRSYGNGKLYKSVQSYPDYNFYGWGTISGPTMANGTLCGPSENKPKQYGGGADDVTPSEYACAPAVHAQRF